MNKGEKQLRLVNHERQLTPKDTPVDLVTAPFSAGKERLERAAAEQLKQLVLAAEGETELTVVSGYRSFKEQQRLYERSLADYGRAHTEQYVARPGCSEHQLGLAVDLGFSDIENDLICPSFTGKAVSARVLAKAADFGFILRYPLGRERQTGIAYEPWHFRFVGCPHSQLIKENDWVLEEYHRWLNAGRLQNE